MAAQGPCWEGYVQVGMKTKGGKGVKYTTGMIPQDKETKRVKIYENGRIRGFEFFDEDNQLILEVGNKIS